MSWNRWASWATTPIASRSDCRVSVPHVHPADPDRPGVGVVDPRNQLGDGGLAGAGRADQRDQLAGLGAEAHPVQDRDDAGAWSGTAMSSSDASETSSAPG